jgi:hypothetical protein
VKHWHGPLADLGAYLRAQITPRARPGGWVAVQLRGGALVAVRRNDDGLVEWRIARKDAPTTDQGRAKWEDELRVFVQHLDLGLAARQPTDTREPNAARFIETFVPADRDA